MGEQSIEHAAAAVHQAYLDTCARLGWPVKPENNVDYADLSEESKDLDRATASAALAALGHSPNCVAPDHYRRVWQEKRDRADRANRAALERIDRLREALQAATDSLGYVLLRCRQMGLDVGRDVSGESWLKPFTGAMKGEHEVLERARAALSADAEQEVSGHD